MLEPNADDPLNKEVRAGSHAWGRLGRGGAAWSEHRERSGLLRRCGGRAQEADRASARARAHSLAAPAPLLATGQAAAMLSDNPRRFADTVKQTFQGRTMQVPPPPAATSHRVCRRLERCVP